jgi:hypothetical protein
LDFIYVGGIKMGLDAECGSVCGRVGSYGWFHSFRNTVCLHLENGVWGSVYPTLQNHSDCDGEFTQEEAKNLSLEINDIEKKFENVEYPCIFNRDGKAIAHKYGDYGDFAYGGGIEYGVNENGLFMFSLNVSKLPEETKDFFERYGEFMVVDKVGRVYGKIVYFKGATKVSGEDWQILLENEEKGQPILKLQAHMFGDEETTEMKFGYQKGIQTFENIIRLFKELCKENKETGEPIVFC